MSKLDGNGRWESKMVLTEHVEQYEARNEKKTSNHPTKEELTMIRDIIMLPHMLTLSDKSLQDVQRSSNMFKDLFARAVQLIMDRIGKDLHRLRRELRNRNIKIYDDETHDGIIYHRYVCRGYEERFGIMREALRSEMSFRFAKYAAEVFQAELEKK